MRALTKNFATFLTYCAVVGTVGVLSIVIPAFPQASPQAWQMTGGLGVVLLFRIVIKNPRFLLPKPEPFFDAKAAVKEFLNRKLPWETP